MTETVRCNATIDGPKIARRVVAWRKYCQNKTRHESGRCHLHRR
jgi:hypothetical protein